MTPPARGTARQKLLDAGEAVVLERGYVAASVDAICERAGVTKGSFFHHFPTKEALGRELVLAFSARQGGQFAEACDGIDDPLDRIYCMVDLASGAADDPRMKGCLVGTVAQEVAETHPELREVCDQCFSGFAEHMGALFQAAKERECPAADFDASGLGRHFLSVVQGAMLLFRTTQDRSVIKTSLAHFRTYLKGLYGR